MSTTYQPSSLPDDVKALVAALRNEFLALKVGLEDAAPFHSFQILHAEPPRVHGGMYVTADGVDWQPDGVNGEGLYRRNLANTLWVFIG